MNEVKGCNENEQIENEANICERDRENGRLRDRKNEHATGGREGDKKGTCEKM